MIQIQPAEYVPITRQLADPQDTTTYYVRAYIYKRKGNGAEVLLDTVNLVDAGSNSQRFTYNYQTPDDSDAYYLSIVTKVFTDSGYTTEATLSWRTEETYLVAMRWGLQFGGGGSVEVNYEKIGKMMQQEVGKIPKVDIKIPKKVDFSPLLQALKEVNNSVKRIEIPKPEKLDFNPMIRAIEKVQQEVKAIDIPRQEKLDLSPVFQAIKKATESLTENVKKVFETNFGSLQGEFKKLSFVTWRVEDEKTKEEKEKIKEMGEELKKFKQKPNRKFI